MDKRDNRRTLNEAIQGHGSIVKRTGTIIRYKKFEVFYELQASCIGILDTKCFSGPATLFGLSIFGVLPKIRSDNV